jgi:predicted nucleotidyltransferase
MRTISIDNLGGVLLGKTRGAVLGLLLDRPDEEYHVRQISRLSGATLGPVQKELKRLEQIGVLKSRRVGHQLLYTADENCPLRDELRSIVNKTVGASGVLKAALQPLESRIQAAFIFGSVALGRQRAASDIDIMVIGDLALAAVVKAIAEPQRRLAREINPTLYRPAEFAAKLVSGHHFLNALMAESKLFLIGNEHELSRLAEKRVAPPAPDHETGHRRPARSG